MINIAICDDNITTTGELETMLQEIARNSKKTFYPVRNRSLLGWKKIGGIGRKGCLL